jgi:hypothetical protein
MATQTGGVTAPDATPSGDAHAVLAGLRAWDRFWFRKADPTTLGLIRICCGLTVLYVHLCYTFDLQQLFGRNAWVDSATITHIRTEMPFPVPNDDWSNPDEHPLPQPRSPEEAKQIDDYRARWYGIDPRLAWVQGWDIWSVWFHVTDPTWMAVTHGCILAVIVLFTLGFCTRITSVLTWVGVISYIQRAPTTLFGMDTMMNVLLIYLMIAPSGAALSLDRLLARWWALRRARLSGRPAPVWQPPTPMVTANFAMRLMQIHFCIIYLASGTSKLLGGPWWNGTALWLTWANYEFAPLDWQRYMDFLVFLSKHRLLWELATSGGVVFTLVLEIGLPTLIWAKQLRWLMIIGAVMLHVGIALTMGLTTFGLFMIALLLSFVPPATVRRLLVSVSSSVWRLSLHGTHGSPAAGLAQAG